tara:strand:- start:3312 stop:3686 length:375 start_codon:yes stop_codon:yes gene_type:complete
VLSNSLSKKGNQLIRKNIILFGIIHSSIMLTVSVWAIMNEPIISLVNLFIHPWFITIFIDAYLGLLFIYLWLAITNKSNKFRLTSFFLILIFGNISIGLIIAYRAYNMENGLNVYRFIKGDLNA